jgi:hypothetical protein
MSCLLTKRRKYLTTKPNNKISLGAVFRDHNGDCLLAASEPLTAFTSPELAEAMALRRAVTIAADQGFDRITFGLDCLSLIQRL